MTRRHGDWHLLGTPADPVPTDEQDVDAVARGFARTAADVAVLAGRLERLSRLDGWKGEAAEVFADAAEDRARDLRKVQRRYEALAEALKGWQGPVRAVRAESQTALTRATKAEEVRRANAASLLTGVAEPTESQLAAEDRREQRLRDARDDLAAAQRQLDTALGSFGRDAERTADRIDGASGTYKDGRWDDLKGVVRDHAGLIKAVVGVLKVVALALAAITLVVALCFSAPFWLLALGVGVGLAILLGDVALVTSESGEATWGDVGWDLLGVVTAGYGAAAARALPRAAAVVKARYADEVFNAVRNQHLADEAATTAGKLVTNASKIKNPLNNLRRWADRELVARTSRAVDAATRGSAAALDELAALSPSALRRLATLDADMARYLQQVTRIEQFGPSQPLVRALDDLRSATQRAVGAGWVNLGGQLPGVPETVRSIPGLPQRLSDGWRLSTTSR